MATKRRKVWVNVHDGGDNGDYATAWLNSKAAKNNSGVRVRAVAVPMVERLPGDVVLSREEVASRKHAAERLESWLKDMKMEGFDECDHIRQSCGDVGCTRPVTDAIALLRGRRKTSVRPVAVKVDDRCPYPGCPGVKDHVECSKCGADHCDCWGRR